MLFVQFNSTRLFCRLKWLGKMDGLLYISKYKNILFHIFVYFLNVIYFAIVLSISLILFY